MNRSAIMRKRNLNPKPLLLRKEKGCRIKLLRGGDCFVGGLLAMTLEVIDIIKKGFIG